MYGGWMQKKQRGAVINDKNESTHLRAREREDESQCHLVLARRVKVPDHGHGQDEQCGVQQGVDDGEAGKHGDKIDAVACGGVSGVESAIEPPEDVDGPALEYGGEEAGYGPPGLEGSDYVESPGEGAVEG